MYVYLFFCFLPLFSLSVCFLHHFIAAIYLIRCLTYFFDFADRQTGETPVVKERRRAEENIADKATVEPRKPHVDARSVFESSTSSSTPAASSPTPSTPSAEQRPLAPDSATMQSQSHQIAEISSLVGRMLQQQQQQQRIVDSRVTQSLQECAEDDFIFASARLQEYYQFVQKCFNESFLAVVVMGTGKFKVDVSSMAMDGLSMIAGSLPVASGIFSAVLMGVEKVSEAREVAKYANLGRLNPSADPLVSRNLSVKIARTLTLQYHSEIEGEVFVKEKSRFTRMKRWFVESVRRVDEKLARGVFGENLSGGQFVALDHSRLALSAVMHMRDDELHSITSSESNMLASLVRAVAYEYTSSGRAQVDPSSSSSSPSSSSLSSSLSVAGISIGGGYAVKESYQHKITELEENAISKKEAAIAKKEAADAKKEAADAKKEAANARIMASDTKRTVDAFFNTSTGVDGHVRTTQVDNGGRLRVLVENPQQDERLNMMADHVMTLDERNRELERQLAEMQLANIQQEKDRRKKRGGWMSFFSKSK